MIMAQTGPHGDNPHSHSKLDDLRDEFDTGTFARGQAYAREGKVRHVTRTAKGCEGEVAGNGNNVYRQSVRLERHGDALDIAGSCSCPMDYNCKHVVAVLLAAMNQRGTALAATPSRNAMHGSPMRWLDQPTSRRKSTPPWGALAGS
jgi:uncharacterized Zn finger protein